MSATKPLSFRESEEMGKYHGEFSATKPMGPTHLQPVYDYHKRSQRSVDSSPEQRVELAIIEKPEGTTATDFQARDAFSVIKSLDANRYATKKTIAQGMLDIALLSAHVSQLKHTLEVGDKNEFYMLLLTLICLSICLQVLQGVLCVFLGSSFNINKTTDQARANIWNNLSLAMMVITVAINIIISGFEIRTNDVYHLS